MQMPDVRGIIAQANEFALGAGESVKMLETAARMDAPSCEQYGDA